MKLLIVLLMITTIVSCRPKPKQTLSSKIPTLELQWETDTLMTTSESVIYDKNSNLIYVSNINENPWDLDYNGFISTLDVNGNIIDHEWLKEDLSGPKGMGIYDGMLYINDINRVVEVNMSTQSITKSYYLDNNPALNDISVGSDGRIYSSCSNTSTIYELVDDHLKELSKVEDARLNGLYADGSNIYFLLSKSEKFGVYNLESNTSEILTEKIGWGDGIIKLPNGNFITSGWTGELFYINAKNWSRTLLLDTKEEGIHAADIDFIPELDLLLVPTFFSNTVKAYKVIF